MNERIKDLDIVALLADLSQEGLPAGQTGTVVMTHNNGEAFEVEFILGPHKSVIASVPRTRLLKLKGSDYPAEAV
jgi:hypothetical protein